MARAWGLTLEEWRGLPDGDRDLMLAERQLVCSVCGNLREVCSDPTRPWFPQRSTCYAGAELAVVKRRLGLGHKEPGWDPHPVDGMSVWVSEDDHSPDDQFIPGVRARREGGAARMP